MKLSRLDITFLKSKIARRIFFLFVGCALLPLVVLTVLTFAHVTRQIKAQGLERLQQSAKAHGMSIYERLLSLESDVQFISTTLQQDCLGAATSLAADKPFVQRLRKRFAAFYLWQDGSAQQLLLDSAPLAFDPVDIGGRQSTKSRIVFLPQEKTPAHVYLLVPVAGTAAPDTMLIAQARSAYFWGVGHENILPPMTELCVLGQGHDVLVSSFSASSTLVQDVAFRANGRAARQFEYDDHGSVFLASFWPLYLKGRFQAPNLTVILRQARADVLAPLKDFTTIFPLVVLLSLWIVLLLSIVFIRRYMVPVERLQEAMAHIGRRDFSRRVEIASGDEFESLARSFNSMSQQLNKQFHTLETIAEISQAILASLNRQQVVETALVRLAVFLHSATSQLILFPSARSPVAISHLYLAASQMISKEEAVEIARTDKERLLAGRYFIQEVSEEAPSYLQSHLHERVTVVLQLPLIHNRELKGLVNFGFADRADIGADDCDHARQLADQITIALANSDLVETLEQLNWGTLEALARTVDAKSPWTAGHSERVTEVAVKVARIMGCGDAEIRTLQQAALVHDIGKIGVPLVILDKPAKLTEEEYETIKEHPAIGARILEPISVFADSINIVLHHHERCDGSGYPDGLRGEDICLGARILAVADVYDALVSERPYRDGWVREKVLDYIEAESGCKFDPEVVKAFLLVV